MITIPDDLSNRLQDLANQGRRIVAIAGPPGGGKSTFSAALCDRLNAGSPGRAMILPMDGFHYDDAVLKERGTLARKGAPFTFDVGGLRSLIQRLRANEETEVAVPVFDRDLEISRAGARLIPRTAPLVLVEGNYLLIGAEPWSQLHPLFDLTIMLSVSAATVERRIVERWTGYGFAADAARERAESNDLPNARFVMTNSVEADCTIPNE